jgi:hypothetical protein
MIRITIEMVPLGNEKRAYVMAQGLIHNDGRGTCARGNYFASISRVAHGRTLVGGGWWKEVKIKDFPRTRLGVWDLLYRSLRELVGDRNR